MKPCSASGDSAFLAQCSKIQTNLNKVWADNKALNIPGFMTTQPPQVNYTVVNGQRLAVPGEGNRLSYVIAGVMDCGAVDPLMKLDGATIHSYSKATPFGFRVAGTDKLTCVIMFGWTTGVGNNLGTTQKNQVSSAGTFEISTFLQPFSSNLAGPALGSPAHLKEMTGSSAETFLAFITMSHSDRANQGAVWLQPIVQFDFRDTLSSTTQNYGTYMSTLNRIDRKNDFSTIKAATNGLPALSKLPKKPPNRQTTLGVTANGNDRFITAKSWGPPMIHSNTSGDAYDVNSWQMQTWTYGGGWFSTLSFDNFPSFRWWDPSVDSLTFSKSSIGQALTTAKIQPVAALWSTFNDYYPIPNLYHLTQSSFDPFSQSSVSAG